VVHLWLREAQLMPLLLVLSAMAKDVHVQVIFLNYFLTKEFSIYLLDVNVLSL